MVCFLLVIQSSLVSCSSLMMHHGSTRFPLFVLCQPIIYYCIFFLKKNPDSIYYIHGVFKMREYEIKSKKNSFSFDRCILRYGYPFHVNRRPKVEKTPTQRNSTRFITRSVSPCLVSTLINEENED